ncbi:MAG: MATE family efflux transporter [Gemmatimonadetes bacterium]|nr:MATE family efflux transporter [Gemmatimonadota bacterium]
MIPRPSWADVASVTRLALPVAGVQVGLMSMGIVDILMVGRVSARDMAAVALGNLYFFAVTVFGIGVLLALDPVVSQAVGAGDREAAARGLQRGLLIALALGVLTSLALLPAEAVLRVASQPAEVVPVAAGYILASVPGTAPFFVFVVFRQSLQAMGRVAPILGVALAANVVNLALNWMFIWGHFGAPAMGAVGSAWASTVSRWFLAVGLLAVAWPVLRPFLLPWRPGVGQVRPLARMVALGAPVGFQMQVEYGAFALVGIFMGWLGAESMAAHQIALNLASVTFMVPLGIGAAAAVRVGQEVGRDNLDGARRAAAAAFVLGTGFMLCTTSLFLFLPAWLGRAFTNDPVVVGVAALLIPVAGVFQIFDGLQAVAGGVLRGAGDTRAPMVAHAIGFWLLGLPLSVLLGFRLGFGPRGLWWGLAVGLAAVAVVLVFRVRTRLGSRIERLVIEEVGS